MANVVVHATQFFLGAHYWIKEIEKIYRVMTCTLAQKVLLRPHMLSEGVNC